MCVIEALCSPNLSSSSLSGGRAVAAVLTPAHRIQWISSVSDMTVSGPCKFNRASFSVFPSLSLTPLHSVSTAVNLNCYSQNFSWWEMKYVPPPPAPWGSRREYTWASHCVSYLCTMQNVEYKPTSASEQGRTKKVKSESCTSDFLLKDFTMSQAFSVAWALSEFCNFRT